MYQYKIEVTLRGANDGSIGFDRFMWYTGTAIANDTYSKFEANRIEWLVYHEVFAKNWNKRFENL